MHLLLALLLEDAWHNKTLPLKIMLELMERSADPDARGPASLAASIWLLLNLLSGAK